MGTRKSKKTVQDVAGDANKYSSNFIQVLLLMGLNVLGGGQLANHEMTDDAS